LEREESANALCAILDGAIDGVLIASFLTALTAKGETADEMTGFIDAMISRATTFSIGPSAIDIVGTGGDLANTVNISTGAAILAAACGIPIAKHGNRSVSSLSGSADVLEALGLEIEIPPEKLGECLHEVNMAFMFAPYYHASLKKLSAVRKALKFPTVFNLLGPLLNPAKAEYALIGVSQESTLELMSEVILQLGSIKRALVFHGSGLDELTPLGKISAYLIDECQMTRLEIDPRDLGFTPCSLADLQGGNAALNASILKEVFAGKTGAVADALAFTAGAALWIFNRASSIQEGIRIARRALHEGRALQVLERWALFSRKLKGDRIDMRKTDYLDEIIKQKKQEVDRLIQITQADPDHPLNKIFKKRRKSQGRFSAALKRPGLAVIAEVKRRSPSRGEIREIIDPTSLALEYCHGGASAVSVLTDMKSFGGSLEDLERISKAVEIPTLRKDFIIHPLQLAEAALAGASAVLLIARLLKSDLKMFIDEAARMGLEALVEVHDTEDLKLAIAAGAQIIGVNHRNLKTFELDLTISERLSPLIPTHITTVAESGIYTPEQAKRVQDFGYNAILVGESLVCANNPREFLNQLIGEHYES